MVQRDKKYEDECFMPFQGLDKTTALQETKVFNDPNINPKKCAFLVTKILYLLLQGETISRSEANTVFFNVTKLFQARDTSLRRMVYIIVKELSQSADQAFVVLNTLLKDVNSSEEFYQANAIRALQKIADQSMIPGLERYLTRAVVDKNPSVSSAALVAGIHIAKQPDLVKRWSNEVNEALKSRHAMVQYHALNLAYKMRQHDRLGVSKLVMSCIQGNFVRSPLAQCLLIKYALRVLQDDGDRAIYNYLETCLRNKTEMVIFEAAKAICSLRNIPAKELTPAISVLQLFLSSNKPTLRYAALRHLNNIAATYPLLVSTCNIDMETLISDSNKNIATLAITTLLKTGGESSIERLMKQITSFMSGVSDDFKTVVVEAMLVLVLKFPQKFHVVLTFLSNALREEGVYEYKKTIVETIIAIVERIPDARETGLGLLSEFIEDCEYNLLLQKILHLLGEQGPKTLTPSKFIRYIYNRVLLESFSVRATAITSLAKFGAYLPELRPSIIVVLKRCIHENDDEVRDRAVFYLSVLQSGDEEQIKYLITQEFAVPISILEYGLNQYKPTAEKPFSLDELPQDLPQQKLEVSKGSKLSTDYDVESPKRLSLESPQTGQGFYPKIFQTIPQLAKLGKPFKSCKPVELTEQETEYVVSCVKHIFAQHIVFQFNVTNTLEDQQLENVLMRMNLADSGLVEQFSIPANQIAPQTSESVFVCVARENPTDYPTGAISNVLRFVTKEVDADTKQVEEEGSDEEYPVEDLELSASDYTQKRRDFDASTFDNEWQQFGEESESLETFVLSTVKTLQSGVENISQLLGLEPLKSPEVGAKTKTCSIQMAGSLVGNVDVLIKCTLVADAATQSVALELVVRSPDENARNLICAAII